MNDLQLSFGSMRLHIHIPFTFAFLVRQHPDPRLREGSWDRGLMYLLVSLNLSYGSSPVVVSTWLVQRRHPAPHQDDGDRIFFLHSLCHIPEVLDLSILVGALAVWH
jgi:hypothetical protein